VVAKYQNYRKAADELFITQTSVYNHVKNLEALLDVALVETSGRNIILTEAGQDFCKIARETITTYENGLYAIKNRKSSYKTTLKVVVTTYIDNYLIPKFLPIFFQKEPNINISTTVLENNIPQAIMEGQYDIGIDRREPFTKKVQYKNVCEGKIQLAVPDISENHSLLTEKEYFQKYRVLTNNHPTYWEDLEKSIIKLYPDVNFVSIASVRSTEDLIKAEQGVSYLPVYIVKGVQQSQIKLIEPKDIIPPISFTYLIWKKESAAIATFNELFEEFVRQEREKVE
jgi:DNA-binding transcriptional LysR family regulator